VEESQLSPGIREEPTKGVAHSIQEELIVPYFKFIRKISMTPRIYAAAQRDKFVLEGVDQALEVVSCVLNLVKAGCQMNPAMRRCGRYFLKEFGLLLNLYDSITSETGLLHNHIRRVITWLLGERSRMPVEKLILLLELIKEYQACIDSIIELAYNRYYEARINYKLHRFKSFD
jgi:hypothetical protein